MLRLFLSHIFRSVMFAPNLRGAGLRACSACRGDSQGTAQIDAICNQINKTPLSVMKR